MSNPERPLVDSQCFELAELFLEDVKGATEDDIWDLAAQFQRTAEDACSEIENRSRAREGGNP